MGEQLQRPLRLFPSMEGDDSENGGAQAENGAQPKDPLCSGNNETCEQTVRHESGQKGLKLAHPTQTKPERTPNTQRINACEGKWRLDIHGLK